MPGPLALLSGARSPSRKCCHSRWWALTPPFHPSPAPFGILRAVGGPAFCCGCSQRKLVPPLPPLVLSWDTLARSNGRGRESGSSSRNPHWAPSDGPPTRSSPFVYHYTSSSPIIQVGKPAGEPASPEKYCLGINDRMWYNPIVCRGCQMSTHRIHVSALSDLPPWSQAMVEVRWEKRCGEYPLRMGRLARRG